MIDTHKIGVGQTHRASGIWQFWCSCGWTCPFSDDDATLGKIAVHLGVRAATPPRDGAADGEGDA